MSDDSGINEDQKAKMIETSFAVDELYLGALDRLREALGMPWRREMERSNRRTAAGRLSRPCGN